MSAQEILVLEANLFSDSETLRNAISRLPSCSSTEVKPSAMTPADWDDLVDKILASKKTIVV